MKRCPYCNNGTISAGYNYLAHKCPDCNGTGYIEEEGIDYWVCEICGKEFDHELDDGICDDCKEKLEEELKEDVMKGENE